MFSFNFDANHEGDEPPSLNQPTWYDAVDAAAQSSSIKSIIPVGRPQLLNGVKTANFRINGLSFKRLADIGEHDIDAESDLIPGVYGGGLKIWECTLDLIKYLTESASQLPPKSCHVLELGCGHGFPGIAAILLGYQKVTFLDLNLEVIHDATWPSIMINSSRGIPTEVQCFAGDWLSFGKLSAENNIVYDFILSSETIYSLETCEQVTYFLSKYLSDDGIAVIATKKFYFGVGGGTFEFENLCRSLGNMSFEIVRTLQDGQSNIRDIILVRKVKF